MQSLKRRVHIGLLLVVTLLSVGYSSARAAMVGRSLLGATAEPQLILVFVEDADGPLAHRMRAEFAALGFEVNLQTTESAAGRSLEEHARAAHAIAAIRVEHNDVGVEMSIMDRTTGKTTSRNISIPSGTEPPAPELVVLRTVELLRASLLELEAPHPSRGDVPPSPKVRALLPPRPQTGTPKKSDLSAVGLAGGADVRKVRGAAPGFDLQLSVDLRPLARVPVYTRLGLRPPLVPMQIKASEGSADLSAISGYLGLLFSSRKSSSRVFGEAGMGLSADWLSTSGTPVGTNSGRTARGLSFSPLFIADMGVRIGSDVALRLDGAIGCAVPTATVRFAGRDVAQWACPWFSVGTSAVVSWF